MSKIKLIERDIEQLEDQSFAAFVNGSPLTKMRVGIDKSRKTQKVESWIPWLTKRS